MSAVARNIDFVSVSEKAPASGFAWVAVRVRIICCYASAIPQPICEALAELFSCRPHRAPVTVRFLHDFPRVCSRSISGSLLLWRISGGSKTFPEQGQTRVVVDSHRGVA